MRVSRNEMIAALSRAHEGAGHHIGDYEDASQAITWSHMCGLGGFDTIVLPPVSPKAEAMAQLEFEADEVAVIDAGGADVCEHGSLAIHLAYAKAQKRGFATVHLVNCQYPGLILQALSLTAQKGVYISAYWQEALGAHGASFESGAAFPNYWQAEAAVAASQAETSNITIICATQPAFLADAIAHQVEHPEVRRNVFSAAQLAANYDHALEKGIEVDQERWDALNASIWPILVAASEQSRGGAGPG